jgi:hypothetical protein
MNTRTVDARRQSAHDHISNFRREKFDLQGDTDVLIRKNPLASDLKESITTLSRDLYAKDTHFIFELIQNAEDNKYLTSEIPSLSFHLCREDPTFTPGSHGALVIENNEVGFSPEQVEALCSVGQSTKRKALGFIGEKGIGFKSVFRVTSQPYVFSNGYSFYLPERHQATDLGYIVPCWVDDLPSGIDPLRTTIILPLDQPSQSFDNIAAYIQQIAPESILFLSKLKQLSLYVEGAYEAVLVKDDSAAPLVHLSHCRSQIGESMNEPTKIAYWLVTQSFEKPDSIHTEKRAQITQSEVTVAFPLDSATSPTAKVFAYLPVCEDAGLPFLINADFLLASSREAVKVDEPWNIWLRTCISETFVMAFSGLLDRQDYQSVAYSFIPLIAHQAFLQPIPEEIHSSLRRRRCVCCDGTDSLQFPSACRMAPQSFRALFVNDVAPSHLRLHPLVTKDIQEWSEQLKRLGVEFLSDRDVLACLGDTEWLASRELTWFVSCYRYLKDNCVLTDLHTRAIVPVEGCRLSCDSEQPIYFPLDNDTRILLESLPLHVRVPVAFLSEELLAGIDKISGLRDWMTQALRIYPFSRGNYAIDVCRWLASNTSALTDDELILATAFLATFTDEPGNLDEIPVLLHDGTRHCYNVLASTHQHVVTPAAANPDDGWQHTFLSSSDRVHLAVLSDFYIHTLRDPDSQSALLSFFAALGVTDAPRPRRRTMRCFILSGWTTSLNCYLTQYEQKLAEKYRYNSASSRLGEMTISNSVPPEFLEHEREAIDNPIACGVSRYRSLRKLLCEYVKATECGSSHLRNHRNGENGLSAEVRYRNYGWNTSWEPSEFLCRLQRCSWVYTTQGFMTPSSVFMDSPGVRQILGDLVPYVQEPLPNEVATLLGLRQHITATEILNVLIDNAKRDTTNIALARRAFQYLNSLDDIPPDAVLRLRSHPIICVPTNNGNWFSASDTIWSDRCDVFGDAFVYLEKHYPKLKEFFTTTLGVKEDVDSECYARRWLALQATPANSAEDVESVLTPIYRELLTLARRMSDAAHKMTNAECNTWWSDFVQEAKIWCRDRCFCLPSECYVPDDGELQRLFRSQHVHFVWRPSKASFSDYEPIFRSLRIAYLSESVCVRLVDEADSIRLENPLFVTEGARVWILTYLKEKYPSEYERVVSSGRHRTLWYTSEFQAGRLILEFTIGKMTCTEDYSAFWDQPKKRLVHRGGDTRKSDLAERLAKEILSDRRYKDFAEQIEPALGEALHDVRRRIRKRNWSVPDEVRELLEESAGRGDGRGGQQQSDLISDGAPEPSDQGGADEGDPEVGAIADSQSEISPGGDSRRRPSEPAPHSPANTEEPAARTAFDYLRSFGQAFTKCGVPHRGDAPLDTYGGVANPGFRRERTQQEIHDERQAEPHMQERFSFVPIKRWEPKNEVTRTKLREWYAGKCQICGVTFHKRDGTPYFEGLYVVSRTRAAWTDRPGNVLCLCANCCAKFQHGTVEAVKDVADQVRSLRVQAEGGTGEAFVEVILCGHAVRIVFDERHLIDLQELLAAGSTETMI